MKPIKFILQFRQNEFFKERFKKRVQNNPKSYPKKRAKGKGYY